MSNRVKKMQPRVEHYLLRFVALIIVACALYFFFHRHSRFFEIVEGRFYRSAQLDTHKLDEIIKRNGIVTVINLRGNSVGKKWFEKEQSLCETNGVSLLDVDMEETDLPRNYVLNDLIISLKKVEKPVLIHCQRGVDPTGFVSALALGIEKDPPLSVIEAQLSHKFGLIPVYRSVGTPIFHAYKTWLKKNTRDHSWEVLEEWLKNEYTQNLTSVQYYVDGINNTRFKHSRLTLDDDLETITFHGWSFNFSTKKPPRYFEIFIDGNPVGSVIFSRNRPDVACYYRLGPPFEQTFVVGWEITIPKNRFTKEKHYLTLKMGSDNEGMLSVIDKFIFSIN